MSLRTGASPATAVAPSARASSTASASPTSKRQGLTLQASAGQAQITGPVPGTVALRWQPVRLTTVAGVEAVLDALPCDVLVVKPGRFETKVERRSRGAQLIALPTAMGA